VAIQIRIDLDRAGIGKLARGAQLQQELLRRANRVKAAAQAEAEEDDRPFITASAITGQRRARASVMWRGGLPGEIQDRILGRAVDAARSG
jgi:hypothetical protein